MQLNDLLVQVPESILSKIAESITGTAEKVVGSLYGTFGKIPRFELTEKVKEQATKEGLYHFVKDDETADIIMQSEHIRPSDEITSYGKKCVFMFCGGPTVDNYIKNMTDDNAILKNNMWEKQVNPYITPNRVATALKITPRMKDLANYKFRGLQDGAFMYEGYCILPPDTVQKVKMVPDLVRDSDGEPIIDENGEYQMAFREASPEELSQDGKTYNAKADYLEYIKSKAIEYGYFDKDGNPRSGVITKAVVLGDLGRMELDESRKNIAKNGLDITNSILDRIKGIFNRSPAVEKSAEESLQDFSFRDKNPYRDKNFALTVAEFQAKDGLSQLDLEDVLSDFTASKDGEFFEKKYN